MMTEKLLRSLSSVKVKLQLENVFITSNYAELLRAATL